MTACPRNRYRSATISGSLRHLQRGWRSQLRALLLVQLHLEIGAWCHGPHRADRGPHSGHRRLATEAILPLADNCGNTAEYQIPGGRNGSTQQDQLPILMPAKCSYAKSATYSRMHCPLMQGKTVEERLQTTAPVGTTCMTYFSRKGKTVLPCLSRTMKSNSFPRFFFPP